MMQRGGFTKGLIIGGIIGASMSMMMNGDMSRKKYKRKMMHDGRDFMRKSGQIISDVVELFR